MSISTCALREEGNRLYNVLCGLLGQFLSTPSARRATGHDRQEQAADGISIHALREEGDTRSRWSSGIRPISIHALREEGDAAAQEAVFLSTPSARRATGTAITEDYVKQISIRALREEGDNILSTSINQRKRISIHALREEGDRHCITSTII